MDTELVAESTGDQAKNSTATENYKGAITEIKKKERLQTHINRESLEALIQTSLLQKQNSQLIEQISAKEKKLKELTNQIASKTHDAKMQKAAQKFVDDARQRLWEMEEARLIQTCKFYEDHWKASSMEIAAIYTEIEKLRSTKKDTVKNVFGLQPYDWAALIEETTPAELPEEVQQTASESDEFDSQEIQRVLQVHESNYRQSSSANTEAGKKTTMHESEERYDYEEENIQSKTHHGTAPGSRDSGFGSFNRAAKTHAPWRQDTKLANQLSYRGGAAQVQQQQEVSSTVRSRPTPTLPTTGQTARGYNQKPMTSHWVTSQFAAKQTSSSKLSAVSSQRARAPATRNESDSEDWGCDADENWQFDDESRPTQHPQAQTNATVEKRVFRPKQPTIK